jgi:hypothetical protein
MAGISRHSVKANRWIIAAQFESPFQAVMMIFAEALHSAVPEFHRIPLVRFNVIHNARRRDAILFQTHFAERLDL